MIGRAKPKKEREFELITHTSPKSAMAEAYRIMRTNLGFASMDNPCRSIMVSSSSPLDGKSTVISNLAVVMAQAGHKVLVVDCDLRKPVQHKIFGVENIRGLTHCLLQKLDVEDVAYNNLIPNLTLLTSGPIPPNPAEILSSERTRSLWPNLLKSYDYILIDTPPVLAVTDASIVSTQVDGVILVVRSAVTRRELARQARDQFAKANARLIGVVLNQVKMDADDYYNYYYYSHDSAPKASMFSF